MPNAPKPRSTGKVIVGIVVATLLLAGVAGLMFAFSQGETISSVITSRGGRTERQSNESLRPNAPDQDVELIGPNGGDLDAITAAAIADLELYWAEMLPKIYGKEYEPVQGGFYAWSPGEPLPKCAESEDDLDGNAYYCGYADEVAWDDTGLMPYLLENYGDLAVGVVMVHEWGHAIQARVGYEGTTVTMEQQADCFAGAWVAHTVEGNSEYFEANGATMDAALAGFLELGDVPGSSASDPMAHGSSFDRINSFQEGFESGPETCAEYTDVNVAERLVQMEFLSYEDAASGGNAAYSEIFDMIDADLNDFWSVTADEEFGEDWTDLKPGQPFDSAVGDRCDGDRVVDAPVYYCSPDRSVHYDDEEYMPAVYAAVGDFGVALEYSLEFMIGALTEHNKLPDNAEERLHLAECLSGAWTGSIFRQDRDNSQMMLSAGDFDEALQIIISTSTADAPGSAFDRVAAFRRGVEDGAAGCSA